MQSSHHPPLYSDDDRQQASRCRSITCRMSAGGPMMINEKLPPTFLGAATPRSVNSQRAPPNRSTGLVAFFSSRRLLAQSGSASSALPGYPPPSHPQTRYTTGLGLGTLVEAVLGLENCPSRLGRSHLHTAENSGLTSIYASACSLGRWVGYCCRLLPSTTLEPVGRLPMSSNNYSILI